MYQVPRAYFIYWILSIHYLAAELAWGRPRETTAPAALMHASQICRISSRVCGGCRISSRGGKKRAGRFCATSSYIYTFTADVGQNETNLGLHLFSTSFFHKMCACFFSKKYVFLPNFYFYSFLLFV